MRVPADEHALSNASPLPSTLTPAEVSLEGKTILVVDDDASTREVVSAALERAGANVCVAASAAEGWNALHDRTPHVMVADLAMPEEDGFSFVRRFRQNSKLGERLPVIALSAFADARSEESARAAGFSAFLAKPAKPEALLGLIDRLLNAPDAP